MSELSLVVYAHMSKWVTILMRRILQSCFYSLPDDEHMVVRISKIM